MTIDENEILGYHKTETAPRLDCKSRLSGVAFYVEDGFYFTPINSNTLIDDSDCRNYSNLLMAFWLEVQNNSLTRVTTNSKSCIGHIISQKQFRSNL